MSFARPAGNMSRSTASSAAGRAMKRRAAFSGTTISIVEKPTPPLPGPFTLRKSQSISRRTAYRWMTSSRFKRWAKFCIRSLARGQIIGGIAQGIGFSLYEKVVWQNGRMQNGQMTNYIMPTSSDLPPIRVFFEELGNVYGAYGAQGHRRTANGRSGPGNRERGGRCARSGRRRFASIPFLCFPKTLWTRFSDSSRHSDATLIGGGR